jgi:hypothetical protein
MSCNINSYTNFEETQPIAPWHNSSYYNPLYSNKASNKIISHTQYPYACIKGILPFSYIRSTLDDEDYEYFKENKMPTLNIRLNYELEPGKIFLFSTDSWHDIAYKIGIKEIVIPPINTIAELRYIKMVIRHGLLIQKNSCHKMFGKPTPQYYLGVDSIDKVIFNGGDENIDELKEYIKMMIDIFIPVVRDMNYYLYTSNHDHMKETTNIIFPNNMRCNEKIHHNVV